MKAGLLAGVFMVGVTLGVSLAHADDWDDEDSVSRFNIYTLPNTLRLTTANDYQLYTPPDYDATQSKAWPLIIFLHGNSEKGEAFDFTRGLPVLINEGMDVPFLVAAPQITPQDDHWSVDYIDAVVDDVIAKQHVDTSRIYITGGSLGAFGSVMGALAQPHRYAAIVPVAGGEIHGIIHWKLELPEKTVRALKKSWYCPIAKTPLRAYHGVMDNLVPIQRAGELFDAIESCEGEAELVAYPTLGHSIYRKTYSDAELYQWLLQFHNEAYQDDAFPDGLAAFEAYQGTYHDRVHGDVTVDIQDNVMLLTLDKYQKTLRYIAINDQQLMGQYGIIEFTQRNKQTLLELGRLGRFKRK